MFKKILVPAVACAAVVGTSLAFAEGGVSVNVPADLSSVDFGSFLDTLATNIKGPIGTILGFAAGIWMISLLWRKLRSVAR